MLNYLTKIRIIEKSHRSHLAQVPINRGSSRNLRRDHVNNIYLNLVTP